MNSNHDRDLAVTIRDCRGDWAAVDSLRELLSGKTVAVTLVDGERECGLNIPADTNAVLCW